MALSDKDRETSQLLLVAHHYISNAKRLAARDKSISRRTIEQVTYEHDKLRLGRDEIILAHLASASTRLCTICEKHISTRKKHNSTSISRYRTHFYSHLKRKPNFKEEQIFQVILADLPRYMPCLLRDNIGHIENASHIGQDRWEILRQLTLGEVLENLSDAYQRFHEMLSNPMPKSMRGPSTGI